MIGNFEQNFNNQLEKPENILNDWDKKYLEKGTFGTIEKMYQDFKNNFPDVIILPERGARPLYYLLDPIFKKLNIEKNTKIPKFVYFSVGKKAGISMQILEQYTDIKTSDDFKALLIDAYYPDMSMENIQKLVDREDVDSVISAREKMTERANEINEKISGKNLHLAIVDEVLSNGATIKEIRKAFNNEDLPAYTLVALSGSDLSAKPGYHFNENDDDNPSVKGHSFSFERAENAIGVTKSFDQKYTQPIKLDDEEEASAMALEKKGLRMEMRSLGEGIANKIISEDLI